VSELVRVFREVRVQQLFLGSKLFRSKVANEDEILRDLRPQVTCIASYVWLCVDCKPFAGSSAKMPPLLLFAL
jgi:hypothetical protein